MTDIRLLTTDDLAKILQLEPSTLIGWRKNGKGPSFTRLGKTVYYPAETVQAWIKQHLQAPIRLARPAPKPLPVPLAATPGPALTSAVLVNSPRPTTDHMSVEELDELVA